MLGSYIHTETITQAPGTNCSARTFEEFREWNEYNEVRGRRKKWHKGGGHHFHTETTRHHLTTAIYESHISAGKSVQFNNVNQILNQGILRTPNLEASFQALYNGNSFHSPYIVPTFEERTDLKKYFRANNLFGRVDSGPYVYGPKVPFSFNLPLMPMVYLGQTISPPNQNNLYLFNPMLEKDLIQKALQTLLKSGYIDNEAGSAEAVFAQLRKNAHDYFVGPTLEISPTQSCSVDSVPGDGDCLFEACLRAMKSLPATHPAHAIANNQALRALVVERLSTRIEDIKAQVYAVLTGALPITMFPPGDFADHLWSQFQKYTWLKDSLDAEIANQVFTAYVNEAPADYIANMSQSGTWGGDLELGIIAQYFNVNIRVHHASNNIAGYQYENTDIIGNELTHPTIDIMYTGNHYDNLKPRVHIPCNEETLRVSPKALLLYQLQNFENRTAYAPILFVPQAIRNAIGIPNTQALIHTENATLKGKSAVN